MNEKQIRRLLAIVMIVAGSVTLANGQAKKAASTPAGGGGGSSAAFESQMLAFGGMQLVAHNLAERVCRETEKTPDRVIVIYDPAAFSTLQSYQAFVANLNAVRSAYLTLLPDRDELNKRLDRAISESDPQGQPGISVERQKAVEREQLDLQKTKESPTKTFSTSVNPVADTASLINALAISSNTENAGQVVIPDSAMALAVTKEMKSQCSNALVAYPPYYGKGSTSDFAAVDIQAELKVLHIVRQAAVDAVAKRNRSAVSEAKSNTTKTSRSNEIDTNPPAPKAPQKKNDDAKPIEERSCKSSEGKEVTEQITSTGPQGDEVLTAALSDIHGLYDSFMNSLLQVNQASGVIGSAAVIQGYQLAGMLRGNCEVGTDKQEKCPSPAYVLLASVVSAGGTQKVHKTLWTALSTGDRISYSGGLMVNVALWRPIENKSPIYTDVLRYRTDYTRIKKPSVQTGSDAGDNLPTN